MRSRGGARARRGSDRLPLNTHPTGVELIGGWAQGAGMVKAEACRTCRYDPYCPGVLGAYARRYGLDELVPVRHQ